MGCELSTDNVHPVDENHNGSFPRVSEQWGVQLTASEARMKFVAEGSLTENADEFQLEFRGLLDDAIARLYVEKFFEENGLDAIYDCWNATLRFSTSTEVESLGSQLEYVVLTHLQPGYDVHKACLHAGLEGQLSQACSAYNSPESRSISPRMLAWLQNLCFNILFDLGYQRFRGTERYSKMIEKLSNKVNVAKPDDFEYAKVIGEGGYGVVVKCRKKSTGICYAMKIQSKDDVMKQCRTAERVDFEKQAFASMVHPFIIELAYAFQTRALVMLVMTLGTYKDLSEVITLEGVLDIERVRFYAAELTSALSYIHSMGLVYRDLKPRNVLLQGTGHIALIDFGSVTDLYGRTLRPAAGEAPIFMREYGRRNPLSNAPHNSHEDPPSGSGLPRSGLSYAGHSQGDEGPSLTKIDSVLTMPITEPNAGSSPRQANSTFADIPEAIEDDDSDKSPCRARSVIGTLGFMAPEIAVMLAQDHSEHAGYTKAVDWWSLGCTVYKLLTGKHPFTTTSDPQMDDALEGTLLQHYNAATKYAVLFEEVDYSHPTIVDNPEVRSVMSKLLTVDEAQRLGYGPRGSSEIKAHPFFATIDWGLLEKAKLPPPYIPPLLEEDSLTPIYGSLAECVSEVGKRNWLRPRKSNHLQRYFSTWNYTSAAAIVAESDYIKSIMPDAAEELSVMR